MIGRKLQPPGDMTLDTLCNSLTRKVGRGEVQVDEIIFIMRPGVGITNDGGQYIARIRIGMVVEEIKKVS